MRVRNAPVELSQSISDLAFQFACNGISENLAFSQPDLTFDAKIHRPQTLAWDLYFNEPPPTLFLTQLQGLHPELILQLQEQPQQDWLAEWKKGWNAFELTPPYWVVPSWLKSPASPKNTIWIDPGMAFGTGTHATTKMASFLMKLAVEESQKTSKKANSVLDVGTGTGILAILAAKLGVEQIDCTDIDPEARRVARENFDRNTCSTAFVYDLQIEDVRESYQVVVANIIDGVLLKLREELNRVLQEDGHLILTGILLEREELFFDRFGLENFSIRQRVQFEEWVGYWVQKS